MSIIDRFKFRRPNSEGVVTDGSQPGARVGLFTEDAVSSLVTMLTRMPDMDEVLQKAGVPRYRLAALLYDDEVAQACDTRLDALLGTPFRVEPSDDAAGNTIMEILSPVLRSALSCAWKARLFGYSVMEAVYFTREDGKIGIQFLGEKPMQWFEPKPDGRLIYYPDSGSAPPSGIEVDQRYKFFLTRSRPTYTHPYGEALLSRLYWPWYFRHNGWNFWGKFLERFGTPLLVGKSGSPDAMVAALLAAHSQAVLGVGPDDAVEAVGSPGSNSGQAFAAFEDAVIRRITKLVLGQTLTSGTDGGSGNRALGQVHEEVRMDKRNSDIALVLPTMQRIVDALCELNGWAKHEVIFGDEVGLEADRATRDKDLYALGVRFEKGYFQDSYALREEDFEMSSKTGPAALLPTPTGVPGTTGDPNATPVATETDKKTPPKGAAAKASREAERLFAQHGEGTRFTRQQEGVEELVETSLDDSGSPIDPEALRSAVLSASSPEDLADRLFALIGDGSTRDQFSRTLERALYAADVLGYVHAEGKE